MRTMKLFFVLEAFLLVVALVALTMGKAYAYNDAPDISARQCVSFRTQQEGGGIAGFGNSLFAHVDNHCGVPVTVIWCWKKKGHNSCDLDNETGVVPEGGTEEVSGPDVAQNLTSAFHAKICDMSDISKSCVGHAEQPVSSNGDAQNSYGAWPMHTTSTKWG
jgi:hypothetical protein